jgi:hypothetical protein
MKRRRAPLSAEHRAKIAAAKRGKARAPHTPEAREKIRARQRERWARDAAKLPPMTAAQRRYYRKLVELNGKADARAWLASGAVVPDHPHPVALPPMPARLRRQYENKRSKTDAATARAWLSERLRGDDDVCMPLHHGD